MTVSVEVICNNLMVVCAFAYMSIDITPFKNLSKVLKHGCVTDQSVLPGVMLTGMEL